MGLSLGKALRLVSRSGTGQADASRLGVSIAFVGSGGKSSALFALARELPGPTLIATTTHLGAWQLSAADMSLVARAPKDLTGLGEHRITAVTGPSAADDRMSATPRGILENLRLHSLNHGWPLLIEADGAREKPLKAPREDEPQIPGFTEVVVVVVGMGALGRLLDGESVHRPELYAQIAGSHLKATVTAEMIGRVLADSRGGLKDVPARSRRIAILNQADTAELRGEAQRIARMIEARFDATIVASLRQGFVHATFEPGAGIVLAAGGAVRFGRPKQLLGWKGEPLVRAAVRAALGAGLSPVIVVTGAYAPQVESALADLPVTTARNREWQGGQSTSIRRALDAVPPQAGSAVFLLADQPLVTPEVIRALTDAHSAEGAAIVAPLIQGDRRGNPVLFDREVFPELRRLSGDEGGRALFRRLAVQYVPWHDDRIVRDIDTEEDYHRLQEETLA